MYFEEKLRQGLSLTYMECFKKNLDDIIQLLLNTKFVCSTPVMLSFKQAVLIASKAKKFQVFSILTLCTLCMLRIVLNQVPVLLLWLLIGYKWIKSTILSKKSSKVFISISIF